jgi:hypothetical protein
MNNEEPFDFQDAINKCNTWAILNGWSVQKKLIHIRAGCTWTTKENEAVIQHFLKGKSLESICNIHGRSPAVIYKKIINNHVIIFEKIIKSNYSTMKLQSLITANYDEVYNFIYNLNQIRNDYYIQLKRNKSTYSYTYIEHLFMAYLITVNKFLQVNPQELFCCSNNTFINTLSYAYRNYDRYFDKKVYDKNVKVVLKKLKTET